MESFQVNFDLHGGLTMEEWCEQYEELKSPAESKRQHAESSKKTRSTN